MINRVVNFLQRSASTRRDDAPPANFYDPQLLLAGSSFTLEPGAEMLVVVQGSGYKYSDDSVYRLKCYPLRSDDDLYPAHLDGPPPATLVDTTVDLMGQLCLVVQNCTEHIRYSVGLFTPLQWLLDCPRVTSKMCFASLMDINRCREQAYADVDEVDGRIPPEMAEAAPNETLVMSRMD